MKTILKSLASASVIFVLSGCGGSSVFEGAPDEKNISLNEGQTKSISVSGGQLDSNYTWSITSGDQVLSISEASTGSAGQSAIETDSSTIYLTSSQVTEDMLLKVQAVELTALGDSKTHVFNVSVANIEAYSQAIDADENNIIEVSVENLSRNNTFTWKQVSGPKLTITENANVANVVIPKVSSNSVAVILVEESNDDGYYNETEITINIIDVPMDVIKLKGSSGDNIKLAYPSPLDDSSYVWSLFSGENITVEGIGDTIDVVLPDVSSPSQSTIIAKQTDVSGIEKSVRFDLEILPKATNSLVFEFKAEDEGVVVVIDGGVESEYLWTQMTGPTIDVSEIDSLRAVLNIPSVPEDSMATFLVKETDSKGDVTRTVVNILIKVEENTGSTVMSMAFTTGDIYPKNTNVIPNVALADDGFAISSYQVKYTDSIGINAVVKSINSIYEWASDGTELDRVDEIISMSVDVAENKNGIIAYISKTNGAQSLSYIRYSDGAWSEPVSLVASSEGVMGNVSVSINDYGKAAISYIKRNSSGFSANHYVTIVSSNGSVLTKNIATAGSLTRSAFESTVSAINARNNDDSVNYTLTDNDVFDGKELLVGDGVVFIDNVGKVYFTYKDIKVNYDITIEDPTVNQTEGASELYSEKTNVTLSFTSKQNNNYSLKTSLINGSSLFNDTVVNSEFNVDFYGSGTRSGKYAVVFDSQNDLGLTDTQVITYNIFNNSEWSTSKYTEHFDDKSFHSSRVAVNESGDVVISSKFEGVNGDTGHQITSFDSEKNHNELSFFVSDISDIDGATAITIDYFGNVLFSYIEESDMLIQTYPKLDSPASRFNVEIDNAENTLWDSNKHGELVVVHYSDVDSGYVHTKQQ